MEILMLFQSVDENVRLVHEGKIMKQSTDIPEGNGFDRIFNSGYGRQGELYLHAEILSIRGLNELKHGGKNLDRLKEVGVFINLDRWQTERAKVVGFVSKVDPTHVWKDDLKQEIKGAVGEVE